MYPFLNKVCIRMCIKVCITLCTKGMISNPIHSSDCIRYRVTNAVTGDRPLNLEAPSEEHTAGTHKEAGELLLVNEFIH